MFILKLLNSIKCLQFLVSCSELALETLLQRCKQAEVLEQPCSSLSHNVVEARREETMLLQRGPKPFQRTGSCSCSLGSSSTREMQSNSKGDAGRRSAWDSDSSAVTTQHSP